MIRLKVREKVDAKFASERRRVNVSEIAAATGLQRITITSWLNDDLERFDKQTLDAWCEYLNCDVCDLLERVPNQ